MRMILFRAKRLDNNEWVYGLLDIYKNNYYITCDDEDYLVDGNTIGQFTGCCDRNNKQIFEGDIIHEHTFMFKHAKYSDYNYEIRFTSGRFCAYKGEVCMNSMLVYAAFSEVIGNIYDNSELLE